MRNRDGFTLIELLVVIAVILILAALLAPALKTARARAMSAVCQSNLGQIATGLYGYLAEHDDQTPQYQEWGSVRRSVPLEDGVRYNVFRRMWTHTEWFKSGPFKGGVRDGDGFLAEYLGTGNTRGNIMGCPEVRQDWGAGIWNGVASPPGRLEYERALGVNLDATAWRFDGGQGVRGRALYEFVRPTGYIFFTDTIGYGSAALAIHHPEAFADPEDFTMATPTPRHLDRWNGAFMDGHVESCTWSENWNPDFFLRGR